MLVGIQFPKNNLVETLFNILELLYKCYIIHF